MQRILFVYDREKSIKNGQFTVRLESRKRFDGKWMRAGPRRAWTGSDIEEMAHTLPSMTLFRTALVSELDFRKMEGRFYSREEEVAILRVSAFELPGFLEKCRKKKALCDEKGALLTFEFRRRVKPMFTMKKKGKDYLVRVFFKHVEYSKLDYVIASEPVVGVHGKKILSLAPGIPFTFLKSISRKGTLSSREREAFTQSLSVYAGKVILRTPDNGEVKIVKKPPRRPILDLDRSLRFANLKFKYPGGAIIPSHDERNIFPDFNNGIELHRNIREEKKRGAILKKLGAIHRPTKRGDWFLSAENNIGMLKALHKRGFYLTVGGSPLRLSDLELRWSVQTKQGLLFVGADVKAGSREGALGNLLDAFLDGERCFRLSDNSVCLIPPSVMDDLTMLERHGDFKDDEIVFDAARFAGVSEFLDQKEGVETDPGFETLTRFGAGAEKLEACPAPPSLETILRPYQKHGFYWLAHLGKFGFGGVLADDMGLGKTLQVLTLLLKLKKKQGAGPALLVAPKTLVYNWELEIRKFTPGLKHLLHTGPDRTRTPDAFHERELVITSYALVRLDLALLKGVHWNYLILDEAQAIKNPRAQTTRAIKEIAADHRLSMTGTPVENSPVDLWSQFDFLMPGFLGGLKEFKDRCAGDARGALEELRKTTGPFILRRLKSQVCLELPLKSEITRFCEFTEGQKRLYDQALLNARKSLAESELDAAGSPMAIHVLTLLLRLRQIACHPSLAPDVDDDSCDSGKHEAVLNAAGEILAEGHKILIFSQFTGHLKLMKKSFEERRWGVHYLSGETRDRMAVIENFKSSEEPCVFFISLKAGGLGLNLTDASYVFLLDPWWNPAVENQAIDRCYRIGQENPVTVYRFITKGSIEEKVSELKEVKARMEKAVVREADIDAVPLTEEALEGLIKESDLK